jgi:hypothetical protein
VTPLVAILGAGASRGSGDYSANALSLTLNQMVPPLTVDLFDEQEYGDVLRQYGLAHQAGRFINHEMATNDALGLEHALHDLATSEFAHHKQMALAVPPYLQHLLHEVSDARYADALHYDRLIERLLRLPYVFFVSLNYDVMLDRRLNGHHQLADLDAYIDNSRNWSLIKPHGSVTWFHPASEQFAPATPPADLSWDSTDFRCVPPDASLLTVRGPHPMETSGKTERYPALATPEGPDDRLVLPEAHRDFFLGKLQSTQEIDILVIGYSGLDKQILELIASANCKLRHMTVVDQDLATATKVVERFKDSGLDPLWRIVVDGDFGSWSNDGGLNLLVDEYDGPYSRSG